MTTVTIPLHLVLSRISESEVSGHSGLVSPSQGRRKVSHSLPQHPHRRRKVSAPPELQPHLGSPAQPPHPGPSPDPSDSRTPQAGYILSVPSQSHLSAGFYSGSDSGVPSEYSSWAAPVARRPLPPAFPDLPSSPASVDDILAQRQTLERQAVPTFYQSDSDCESMDETPPPQGRSGSGGGMTNPAYTNTEATPVVLPVGSPPPLTRVPTEPTLTSPSPSVLGIANQNRRHSHSMVLQLNLQGASPPITGLVAGNPAGLMTGPNGRSVSMVSLSGQPQPQQQQQQQQQGAPAHSLYPNLHNDNQSIYSELAFGGQAPQYLPPPALSLKMAEGQQALNGEATIGVQDGGDNDEPLPTEEGEKKAWFQHTLSENMSIMYAVFLVTFGLVIYLADTFSGHDSAMAEGFNVFLIVTQLLWLFSVHVDVRRYVSTISRALDESKARAANKEDQVHLEPTGDGQYQLRFNVPEPPRIIPQHYGFTSGRHGGSLYLKIGATVFCLGYLIHTGLNLGQKILYLTEDDPVFESCTCTTDVVMSVLQPVYAFYQLFFIFKYSNLIINRRLILSRFGIMHCIASSLCFWVYTILQETLQAIFMKRGAHYNSDAYTTTDSLKHLADDSEEVEDDMMSFTGKKLAAASSSSWSISYGCEKDTDLSNMINTTTPYLYPFSIEFNILIVGIWILLWENIGKFERHTHIPSVEVTYEEDNSRSLTSNLIIYVDCHASNRGLFAGLLMTVATVISIILFFIFSASDDDNTRQLGSYLNGASEVILLSCMLVTAFFAYNSVRILDVIRHGMSAVDDILLYICLPCIFMYAFLSIVPSINNGNYLAVSVSILQVSQVILQTALICDGLRRCSNSQTLQHKKPGREVITYLVVTNVAMWLLQTFEIKSAEGNASLYDFYGKELWTLLSHLTLPLALFYRFHSSVCLADMWKASYESEEH